MPTERALGADAIDEVTNDPWAVLDADTFVSIYWSIKCERLTFLALAPTL